MDSSAQQELAAEYAQFLFADYIGIAGAVLYIYDFILTLPVEISQIWPSRFSGTKAVFLLCRYSALIYWCFDAITGYSPISNISTCAGLIRTTNTLQAISDIGLTVIFILRTFAIYNQNWIILIGLTTLGVARACVGLASQNFQESFAVVPPPFSRLGPCDSNVSSIGLKLSIAQNALVLCFDSIVLLLTLAKTLQLAMESRSLGLREGISGIILRDGILYYLCIEGLVVANICVNFIPMTTQYLPSIVETFQLVLSIILVNRLVLNLRKAGNRDSSTFSEISQPRFATNGFLDNIGASLRNGSDDMDIGEDLEEHELEDRGITQGDENACA